MSDDVHFDKVMKGYGVLTSQLVTDWSPYVTKVATKLSGGNYQAADAETDFAEGFKLAMESLMAFGFEALDAVSIMTSTYSELEHIHGYHADPAHAGTARTLAVKADLVSFSGETLPKARVTTTPATLAPKDIAFDLDVNGDGMKARTYEGVVVATDASGGIEEIKVSVTIG
jgi:hypothetical protein